MTAFRTIDDLEVNGKTVLVRADLNVPMENGRVTDATRITRFAPTAKELAQKGAKVVIISHFGRPKKGPEDEFSLKHLVKDLSAALGQPVHFAEDCVGPTAEKAVKVLQPGQFLLLENVRFHPWEEKNDPGFAESLAKLGDLYVNDAFSAAHRAHASTAGIAAHLPAAAGRMMQAELEALTKALETPTHPLMAIVGGSKISTKLELLENLVGKVDILAIGGGMAYTFLLAQGISVGKSICEPALIDKAKATMEAARARGCRLVLAEDLIVTADIKSGHGEKVSVNAIPADKEGVDIGPATLAKFESLLAEARTVVWNGPVGAFEFAPFDAGTKAIASILAKRTQQGLISVAGGGDTVAALEAAGVADDLTYVSAAGGAFLEWLEGKQLPGVEALKAAKKKAA